MPMASFHIFILPNDPHVQRYHWSLGKIAKRMPREHEKCACLNLNDFHLSVFSEGVCLSVTYPNCGMKKHIKPIFLKQVFCRHVILHEILSCAYE